MTLENIRKRLEKIREDMKKLKAEEKKYMGMEKVAEDTEKLKIIQKSSLDIRIIRIKTLGAQLIPQVCDTVLKFLSDKAEKHQREHHVTLLKKRA